MVLTLGWPISNHLSSMTLYSVSVTYNLYLPPMAQIYLPNTYKLKLESLYNNI